MITDFLRRAPRTAPAEGLVRRHDGSGRYWNRIARPRELADVDRMLAGWRGQHVTTADTLPADRAPARVGDTVPIARSHLLAHICPDGRHR